MPEFAMEAAPSQRERGAQIQATGLLMQHELDNGARSLMGISCPSGIFSGLQGLSQEREALLAAFQRGESYSVSGSGMDQRNLEILEGLSGTLERYGITMQVDMERGEFTLTNHNYVPLHLIPEGDRLALVQANNFASECVERATMLANQGRMDEAEGYLKWAAALQARYSEYVEGARMLEGMNGERGVLAALPPVGASERGARDAISGLAGRELTPQEFPAEFERMMGVSWAQFREFGFASLAMQNVDAAMESMGAGLSSLAERMNGMCGATERAITGAGIQDYLPPEEYTYAAASARDSMAFSASLRDDVFAISGLRRAADGLRELAFEGASLYRDELIGERDGILGMYVQAESSLSRSIFLRSAIPGSREDAEGNYSDSQAERVRAAHFLARAEEQIPGLSERYAMFSRYGSAQEILMAQDFGEVDGVNRAELVRRRDGLVDEISAAAREGREIQGLEGRIAGLSRTYEHMQLRSFWTDYQFGDVRGNAGLARLNIDRNALLDSLERAIESGAEIPNLLARQDGIFTMHERCAAYERLVTELYESQRERIRGVSSTFHGFGETIGRDARGFPDEARGIVLRGLNFDSGKMEWDEDVQLADYRSRKRELKEELFTFMGNAIQLSNQITELEGWYEDAMRYVPREMEIEDLGPEVADLRERFGIFENPAMAGIRQVHDNAERIAERLERGAAGILTRFNGMATEINQIAREQSDMASIYRLNSQVETVTAAVGVVVAVWNLPSVISAGRSLFAQGRAAMGAIESFSPGLATGIRLGLTAGSIGMSAYGVREFSAGVSEFRNANTAEERVAAAEHMFEGALYVGSLGVAARLPQNIFRMARAASVGMDIGAIATIAPSVAAVSYSMSERGDVSGWDIAELAFWTGLGIGGAYLGVRVPGGLRPAVREGGEIAARAAPEGIVQFSDMAAHLPAPRGFAAEGAGFVRVGELPAPLGPMQRGAMEEEARIAAMHTELAPQPGAAVSGREATELMPSPAVRAEAPAAMERAATEVAPSPAARRAARGEVPPTMIERPPAQAAPPAAVRAEAPVPMERAATDVAPVPRVGTPGAAVTGREATELMPSPAAREGAGAAPMSAEELRAVQDARAVERLVSEYEAVRAAFTRERGVRHRVVRYYPEVREVEGIMNASPGMGVRQAAEEYVAGARANGRPLPERLISEPGAALDSLSAEMGRASQGAPPQELPPVVFPQSPRASVDEIAASLERLGSADHRAYMASHFRGRQPTEAALDNAMALFGRREGVAGDFRGVLHNESVGVNAGVDRVAVNGYIDESGRIIAFGNIASIPPEILERGIPFTIRIETRTGRIFDAILKRQGTELPESLSSLVGMQVETPLVAASAARRAAEAFAPTVAISNEIMARHSTIFNADEIMTMWGNLQRGIFVTPRAGTEMQAKILYEDFIRAAAGQSPTGEVSGIMIRGDMSGVGVGNDMLGAPFMDRTIMMRMRGVREAIMETAQRLGIEGITPIFTRRPGRSDEFMVAIFGPRDSVVANAGEFLNALRAAPSGRIARICNSERFGGRSFMRAAAEGLEHPESIRMFKFDYAPFTVSGSTPRGVLDETAGRAMMSGSAAHTAAVADVVGMPRTDLLFMPNSSIAQMMPGRPLSGGLFDVAFTMPATVRRDVEVALGRDILPRLDEMVGRNILTAGEREAIRRSIAANGGRLPLDDAARHLFRKGTGQALSGEQRIRLLNSLIGEERFNPYATMVDDAIARYAAEHGISIRRPTGAPTMQYSIEEVRGADLARHRAGLEGAIENALSAEGVRLIPMVRSFDAPAGLTAETVDAFLSAQRSGGIRPATWMAGEFTVTAFGSGHPSHREFILSLVPEQSRASMMEIMDTVRGGRGITKLNDLFEVLQRTDPALYENFVRILESPGFMEGMMRVMPSDRANALRGLMGLPF